MEFGFHLYFYDELGLKYFRSEILFRPSSKICTVRTVQFYSSHSSIILFSFQILAHKKERLLLDTAPPNPKLTASLK